MSLVSIENKAEGTIFSNVVKKSIEKYQEELKAKQLKEENLLKMKAVEDLFFKQCIASEETLRKFFYYVNIKKDSQIVISYKDYHGTVFELRGKLDDKKNEFVITLETSTDESDESSAVLKIIALDQHKFANKFIEEAFVSFFEEGFNLENMLERENESASDNPKINALAKHLNAPVKDISLVNEITGMNKESIFVVGDIGVKYIVHSAEERQRDLSAIVWEEFKNKWYSSETLARLTGETVESISELMKEENYTKLKDIVLSTCGPDKFVEGIIEEIGYGDWYQFEVDGFFIYKY